MRLRTYIDSNTMLELKEVESSAQPERHKTAKKNSIRRRHAQYRLVRRRHVLEGIYDSTDSVLTDTQTIGVEILAHWQPVFTEPDADADDMTDSLSFVQICDLREWQWPHGAWVESLAGVPNTAPGPDGLPYSLWKCAPRSWTVQVDSMAEAASGGQPLPRWVLDSFTVCIPKGEFNEDADRVLRRSHCLRLITLMNTVAKIIARGADSALSAIAAGSVATPQRGFVAGRCIDDNIFELGGALIEYSQCGSSACLLLVDFLAAFPSLSRKFMFSVLEAMRLPVQLLNLIRELYRDLDTGVKVGGEEVCRLRSGSGI